MASLESSSWSWKQKVADAVVAIVTSSGSTRFTLEDIYRFEASFALAFPRNRHIRDKVRQVLQQLRDDGFILFAGAGVYDLQTTHESLGLPPDAPLPAGNPVPPVKDIVRKLRLRDTLLATEIRRRYNNICQVCRLPVHLTPGRFYAEGHHLRPLGAPHFGPDLPGIIIVLCPNHHIMFDRGVMMIEPRTLRLAHLGGHTLPQQKLYVEPWHCLDAAALAYHEQSIFSRVRMSLN